MKKNWRKKIAQQSKMQKSSSSLQWDALLGNKDNGIMKHVNAKMRKHYM